jgi:hypothetical protein
MFWNRKRKERRPDGGGLSVIGTTDPAYMGGIVGPCDSTMYAYQAHTAWFDRPDADEHIGGLLAQEHRSIVIPTFADGAVASA